MSDPSAPVVNTKGRVGIVEGGLSGIVMIDATSWCTYVGGGSNSTVAIGAGTGPIMGKGVMCSSWRAVGDIRGYKVVEGGGSTCSGPGKEACELQDIIKDT